MRVKLGPTWLDPEELAYPAGSLRQSRRRARARFPDGRLRIVVVSIPDTYFSIPARSAHHGHGYLDVGEGEFRFTPRQRGEINYNRVSNPDGV